MIDPSSSEEESEEDQSTHHGGGSGGGAGRPGSGSSHGSRRHPGSIGSGPGSGSVGSLASGLTASPGGTNHVGHSGTASSHASGGRVVASQDSTGAGLDVPNLSARNSLSPSMSAAQDAASYAQRPTSPSPSVASEKTEAELQVRMFLTFFFVVTA